MQTAARKLSPETVLALTLIVSAFPLVAVEVFPDLKFVIAPSSYLLFHNIAEFFSVMVSLSMFGIGWYTYDQSKNRHALFLSIAFLGIGLMDFMHTLANAAMPPFITPNSSNKSTQFWIAVRLFQAVAFLVSAFVYSERPGRWLSKKPLMACALLIPFLVFAGITFFPAYVPDTFVPGAGLTPFKRISEYLIIGMLCAAAAAYWRRMTRTGDRLLIYYMGAFVICIFSELPLAVYTKVFDTYNVLGHIYKVAAFYLIYHGIYRASVMAPYTGLMEVGEKLKEEIVERKRTEEALRLAHDNLELRVRERTSELAQSNARLRTEVEDRRRAEQALREAHDRALWLARFPDENPSPVLRVSVDGTVLYCNSSAVELHGWTCAVGQPLDHRLLPLVRGAMAKSAEGYQDVEIGTRFYSVWVAPLPKEGYANVYGRDITDRKRTEEELRLAYGRLQTFFDHRIGGIGIVIASADGDIIRANDYYLSVLGCTREELESGRVDWRRMPPPEWLPEDERALAQLRERGVCDTYEKEYVRRDGSRVPVLITDAMMPGDSGDILAFVLDITIRKRGEEALQKAHAQLQDHALRLQETNRELEGFAYTVSHDLRAPLRAINGFARLLADDYGPSLEAEGNRRLRVIETNAIKMGALIDDLLAFSRAGRTAMNISRIDMNRLVAEVVDALTSDEGAKADIRVAALPTARGDHALIRQVLANLLENAVKFSRNRPDPKIEVGSLERDGELIYFVKDNGVGFDLKYYGKLFGVFQRLVSENEFEGTGVGLAIVHRLVTRHGGRVWAESRPGEGATFFFTLNRRDGEHG